MQIGVLPNYMLSVYHYDQIMFCSFVGGALQHDHTEHAQKATANNKSPSVFIKRLDFFVPETFLWRLAPMQSMTHYASMRMRKRGIR